MIHFSQFQFSPVVSLPADYEVYDFTQSYDPNRPLKVPFGIGKYDEQRRNMYTAPLFSGNSGKRDIHMGIDISAPIGTEVMAFYPGEIFLVGNNDQAGDYGYTIITRHILEDTALYALFGHLSAASIVDKIPGQQFRSGEILAWVGNKEENGGWNPHLHFQLSYKKPERCDMPGVVSKADREASLAIYPDPQLVLGKLY